MTRGLALTVSALALLAGLLSPPTAVAAAPTSGTGHTYPDFVPKQSDPRVLRKAWRAWQRVDASDYVLRVQNFCFCPERPPVETEVEDDEVVSVTYLGRTRELRRKGYDMDRMFLILRRAYAHADRLDVRYSDRGIPYRIFIDWQLMVADEEANYAVKLRGLHG